MEKNKLIIVVLIGAAAIVLVAFAMGLFDNQEGAPGDGTGRDRGWRYPLGQRPDNMTWEPPENMSEEVLALLEELREARAAGDTERMEEIQEQLSELGFERDLPNRDVSRNRN